MLTAPVIVIASFAYVGLLFAIAYYGDKRADAGRSINGNPFIYALSLAVYCTSWTFYGSVGRATSSGWMRSAGTSARTSAALAAYARRRGLPGAQELEADAEMVNFTETLLA